MMRAILKLKSDGAQALLTAALLAGCALNALLLMAYAGRMAQGSRDTAGLVSQAVVVLPAGSESAGNRESARHRAHLDIAGLARSYLPRPFRPS